MVRTARYSVEEEGAQLREIVLARKFKVCRSNLPGGCQDCDPLLPFGRYPLLPLGWNPPPPLDGNPLLPLGGNPLLPFDATRGAKGCGGEGPLPRNPPPWTTGLGPGGGGHELCCWSCCCGRGGGTDVGCGCQDELVSLLGPGYEVPTEPANPPGFCVSGAGGGREGGVNSLLQRKGGLAGGDEVRF